MDKDKEFKASKDRANAAGACGLSVIRCSEIVKTSVDDILEALRDGEDKDFKALSERIAKALKSMQNDVSDVTTLGTKVAAGSFNQEVALQRKLLIASKQGSLIKDTLSQCLPTAILTFDDKGSRIKDALEAARAHPRPSYQPKSSSRSFFKDIPKKSFYPSKPESKSFSAPAKSTGNGRGRFQKGRGGGRKK